MRVLCVHGVGHAEVEPQFPGDWYDVIREAMLASNPNVQGKRIQRR